MARAPHPNQACAAARIAHLEVDRLGTAARERCVKHARESRHDGRRVDSPRDEVHVDEVVSYELVVAVDQMGDRLDHA
eukprot:3590130-Prymnesium_polylepis.1